MSNLLDYGEELIISHALRDPTWAKPNDGNGVYMVAFETQPTEAGLSFVEATYPGYARALVAQDNASFSLSTDADGVIATSTAAVAWPAPTAAANTLTGYGVADAATGGNIILADLFGPDGAPETVSPVVGQGVEIPAGSLTFSVGNTSQRITDIFASLVLNHIFRTDTWSKPGANDLTMDLCTTLYDKAGAGGVELSGNGYVAPVVGPGDLLWQAPAQTPPEASTQNLAVITAGTPSVQWSGIAGHVLKSAGVVWLRQPYTVPVDYPAGQQVWMPSGSATLTVN